MNYWGPKGKNSTSNISQVWGIFQFIDSPCACMIVCTLTFLPQMFGVSKNVTPWFVYHLILYTLGCAEQFMVLRWMSKLNACLFSAALSTTASVTSALSKMAPNLVLKGRFSFFFTNWRIHHKIHPNFLDEFVEGKYNFCQSPSLIWKHGLNRTPSILEAIKYWKYLPKSAKTALKY